MFGSAVQEPCGSGTPKLGRKSRAVETLCSPIAWWLRWLGVLATQSQGPCEAEHLRESQLSLGMSFLLFLVGMQALLSTRRSSIGGITHAETWMPLSQKWNWLWQLDPKHDAEKR